MRKVVVERALVSTYDKTGLSAFAAALVAEGVEIVSSGGTAAALEEAGLSVIRVTDVTGSPEILGGRVKTLHPKVHGGILARADEPSDLSELEANGIEPIQLVVVNLYPFRETLSDEASSEVDIVEKIDIGGPAMIRAAAKNFRHVGVVTSPSQYETVAAAIASGGLDETLRRELAAEAFFQTAAYDGAITEWLGESKVIALRKHAELRYGENPQQGAALFAEDRSSPWWALAEQHQGKEMSFNNYADAEAAWALAGELAAPSVVVVKHTNAAGAARGTSVPDAFARAWAGDPLAAFGGVVAVHGTLDGATALEIAERFIEVVVATDATEEALSILTKKPNLRVLSAPLVLHEDLDYRRVESGFLVQDRDFVGQESWSTVTHRQPTPDELKALEFAWRVATSAKSNAIVLANGEAAVGVGAGDQSRVGAAERAVAKAGERSFGAVAASDAFFPFRDGLDLLAEAGVTAVVEPGGSRNDQEVIDAADEHGISLVFATRRHFRH